MLCNGLSPQEVSKLYHQNSNYNYLPKFQKLALGIYKGLIYNRGSHTFSIPASINGEVPCGSFPLGACVLRSSHSPIICRSHSPPPTLKNWVSQSFPEEFFILRLQEFTLLRRFHRHFLLHRRRGSSSDRRVAQVCNSFSGFHSRCFTCQKGVSHLLHAQHQSIGSVFLSRTLHS